MYTQENYIWGMVAYGLGVVLVLPAMLKTTSLVMPWKPLRVVLRVFFTALLVTPVYAYKDVQFMAPAWIVAGFETVRQTSPEGPAMAYAALTSCFIGLLLLTAIYYLARHFLLKAKGGKAEDDNETGAAEAGA